MNAAPDREVFEEALQSCLRVIATAQPGKEKSVFAEWSRYAMDHALKAGIDKVDAVDRLHEAGIAIGLDESFIQDCLAEVVRRAEGGGEPGEKECGTTDAPRAGLVVRRMVDVLMRSVSWLWPDRIALGKLTLLSGEGGLGKTTALMDIAARCTRGDVWPDGVGRAPLGNVIILTAEDDPEDTLAPRLAAAGADMSRVLVVEMVRPADGPERAFNVQVDLAELDQLITNTGNVVAIIIDPVTAYLGNVDSHKNAELRGVLTPLGQLAAKHGVAIVGNTHFSKSGKSGGSNANHKVIGSVAFVNYARVVLQVWQDPEDKDRRLFVVSKSNISRIGDALAFRIEQCAVGDGTIIATRVMWESTPVQISADEIMAATAGGDGTKTLKAEAIEFLEDELAAGPVPAAELKKRATAAGHSPKAVRMAKDKLGIKPEKDGYQGKWVWSLSKRPSGPKDALSQNRAPLDGEGTFGAGPGQEDAP